MLPEPTMMKTFYPDPSESSRPIKKPRHYAYQEGKAFIEIMGQKHAINGLLDSHSNIFLMNKDTARRLEIATEVRDSLLKIRTFDGETTPTRGTFYQHPILVEIGTNGHRSMISCEIANVGIYDLIIPFWLWHNEHPLKNIANPSKWVFEGTKCYAHIEGEAVTDLFEWYESVAYDEQAQYIERIRQKDEGGVQLETLPKPY